MTEQIEQIAPTPSEAELATIERCRGELASGRTFQLARAAHATRGGDAWVMVSAGAVQTAYRELAELARTPALVQMVSGLLPAVNPYASMGDFCANLFTAAVQVTQAGYEDIERRTGPDAPRPSETHRPWTFAELVETNLRLQRAIKGASSSAGTGWVLAHFAREIGMERLIDSPRR